jgi:hypothetical protein
MVRTNNRIYQVVFLLFMYLFINGLFVIKYGERLKIISEFIILFGYCFLVLGILYLFKKYLKKIQEYRSFIILYWILIFVVFCFFIILNFLIDGNSLNTDRWSAMQVTIESILKGVYPYNQLDHLGQTSSNLPSLSYLGLPFYMLGNIGLLQPFVFLGFSFWIFKSNRLKSKKLLIILLLIMSPAYLWEVVAKSDLMSNLLLLIIFIDYWKEKYNENSFQKLEILAFIVAFFSLTRGIVIIPLTLMLFYDFLKLKIRLKFKFVIIFIISLFVLLLPILLVLPEFEVLSEHNPFNHQTKYAPKFLIILSLLSPFFVSKYSKSSTNVYKITFYVLSFLLIPAFILNVYEEGFYNNIYENLFDISYLGMIIPFIIMSK